MECSRHSLPAARLSLLGALCCLLPALAPAPLRAERTPADLERERFLRQAEIGRTRTIDVGVTASLRATLTLGDLSHDAHIQRVDKLYPRYRKERRNYLNFRDSYRFNIAAYRLDRLLGLDMVPVSVERKYQRKPAAVTWWVDDVLMTAADRLENQAKPPDPISWQNQKSRARVFHQLICNEDPNLSNVLIDAAWRLWLIDFTRSFHASRRLPKPELVQRIDRRFYDGLKELTLTALQREVAPHLNRSEMKAVLTRRDRILDLLAKRIADRGEAAVLFDLPGR